MEISFLLHAAGIGQHDARMMQQLAHVEIADGPMTRMPGAVGIDARLSSLPPTRPRVNRENDRLLRALPPR